VNHAEAIGAQRTLVYEYMVEQFIHATNLPVKGKFVEMPAVPHDRDKEAENRNCATRSRAQNFSGGPSPQQIDNT